MLGPGGLQSWRNRIFFGSSPMGDEEKLFIWVQMWDRQ